MDTQRVSNVVEILRGIVDQFDYNDCFTDVTILDPQDNPVLVNEELASKVLDAIVYLNYLDTADEEINLLDEDEADFMSCDDLFCEPDDIR